MSDRPWSELTKHFTPEDREVVEAGAAEIVADSDRRERLEQRRGSRAPAAHPSRAAGRPARSGNRPRPMIPVLVSYPTIAFTQFYGSEVAARQGTDTISRALSRLSRQKRVTQPLAIL